MTKEELPYNQEEKGQVTESNVAHHCFVVVRKEETGRGSGVHYKFPAKKQADGTFVDAQGHVYEVASSSATFTHTAGSEDNVGDDADEDHDDAKYWSYTLAPDGVNIHIKYVGPELPEREMSVIALKKAFELNDPDFKGLVTPSGLKRMLQDYDIIDQQVRIKIVKLMKQRNKYFHTLDRGFDRTG